MKRIVIVAILAFLLAPLVRGDEKDRERQRKIDSNRTPVDWSAPKTRTLPEGERIRVTAPETRSGFQPFVIQYDTGLVTAVPTIGSVMYGNRFDTREGAPLFTSCSVPTLQFYMAGVGGSAVFVSMFGPPAGTTAPLITSLLVNATTGFNTVTFATPQVFTGTSFLLGVWADQVPISDLVGLDSGTVAGQGHHGVIINDIVGTGFQTLPGLNAIVRPTVFIYPVELLSFTVDEP